MRTIEEILRESKIIAVVGLNPKPEKDSHRVARYLQEQGYRIIPVNPFCDEILGERCYPSLSAIPEKVDIVDIFRRPEYLLPIVDEAIQIGAKVIWMQLEIINEQAADRARQHGLDVVIDK